MPSKNYDVIVVGGGPAGMMAAGRAAELGAKVVLLEKNDKLGKKLLITGGGRCNITNAEYEVRKMVSNYGPKGKALFGSFTRFGVQESLEFFNSRGLATKVEAEKRAFPVDQQMACDSADQGPERAADREADDGRGVERAGAHALLTAAVQERSRTGQGRHIDVSMLESMVEWMNYPMYYAYEGATPPLRAGAAHATIYPYGPFNAGDGKSVMLGLQNEREWASFCDVVLKVPQLVTDVRFKSNSDRVANRIELKEIIDQTFNALTAEQVVKLLEDAQIANAHVNDMHDVWNHPQLKARDRWVSVGTSEGPIPALLPPGRTNAFNPRMDAVPGLGQHSESILSELGFSNERIQNMRHAKSI